MMYYLAFVFVDVDVTGTAIGYGFTCPDVPGFTAHAETGDFAEAVSIARGVLGDHIAAMIDAGGEVPAPRALATIKNDPECGEDWNEAQTTVMLPALLPAGRTVRVNLSFDENTLDLIDRAATERRLSRSAFVAEAARRFATAA